MSDEKKGPRATALEARRAFLSRMSKAALAAPPAASLILAATKPAYATPPYGKTKKDKKPKKDKKWGHHEHPHHP